MCQMPYVCARARARARHDQYFYILCCCCCCCCWNVCYGSKQFVQSLIQNNHPSVKTPLLTDTRRGWRCCGLTAAAPMQLQPGVPLWRQLWRPAECLCCTGSCRSCSGRSAGRSTSRSRCARSAQRPGPGPGPGTAGAPLGR